MKIISQTADEMVLKDGNFFGMFFGIILLIVSIAVCLIPIPHGPFYVTSYPFVSAGVRWSSFGVLALFGLVVIFLSSFITIDITKANGKFIYRKKCLIGGLTTIYLIADVLRIETRRQWQIGNFSSGRGAPVSRRFLSVQSVVIFKNGQELMLDRKTTTQDMSVGGVAAVSPRNEAGFGSQVAEFIGVPFQETVPPNTA